MHFWEALCHLTWIRTRMINHRYRLDKHRQAIVELNRLVDRLQQQANWNAQVNEGALEALKQRLRRLEGTLLALEGTPEAGEDVPKDSHFWHN